MGFFPFIFTQFIYFYSNYLIQFLILITTYVVLDFLSLIAYAVAANNLIVWFKVNPKVVLWFHYEGNDFQELKRELNRKILNKYLINENFTQKLVLKQNEESRKSVLKILR